MATFGNISNVADGRVKMTDGEATWEKGEEGIEVQKE
jgi:hypothetical protein